MTVSWRRSAASSAGVSDAEPATTTGDERHCRVEISDGFQDAFTGSQRQSDLFEIGFRQIDKNVSLDLVVAKQSLVLGQPEAAQPSPHIHVRFPLDTDDGPIEPECLGHRLGCSVLGRDPSVRNREPNG